MVKILYLYQTLAVGGAEQLLFTTLKYLDRSDFTPLVYCIGENGQLGEEIEGLGISVKALNKKIYLSNLEIVQDLVKIFKKEKPDILHTNLFYPNYFGRIAAIFSGVPVVVVTEHGTHSNFKNFFHHGIDFMLSFFTKKLIAVSHAVEKYLRRYSMIPSRKITVIYNAVDFDRFDKAYVLDKDSVRQKLGFSNSDILIGSVSNLAPWKGQDFLLRAYSKVIKNFPQAKLCIVGRNNAGFMEQLEVFTKKNGIYDNVFFLGERRDIPEIMRAFDIFVFPSLTEGLGISLLEAMYMGLPAIASSIEGILEIIDNNQNGILVPSGDYDILYKKILLLLENKDTMQRIGLNAREHVKRFFSPHSYIEKLQQLYKNG